MKRKELIFSTVILPLIVGVVLCAVMLLIAAPKLSTILPIDEGTVFAYHDKIDNNAKMVEFDGDMSKLKPNDIIGTVKILGNDINIKYDCDYSSAANSLSMSNQAAYFGDIGCTYLKANLGSAKVIEGEIEIDIESIFGNYKYKLVDQYTAKNEHQITSTAPDMPRSMVIYYQDSDSAGLSSSYKALVYEEVA